MNQSFETQLQVVLRALGDVVAPALADADKHVVEQLHLSMATIGFVAAHLPQERRYFRHELTLHADLARALIDLGGGDGLGEALRREVASAEAALARADAEVSDYQAITRAFREGIAELSNAAIGCACKPAIDRTILARSEEIVLQSRQWVLPFGFELRPETLPAPGW